jgi:hypothetical protein
VCAVEGPQCRDSRVGNQGAARKTETLGFLDMYAALTHALDAVGEGCIDVDTLTQSQSALLERAQRNLRRAAELAAHGAANVAPPWVFASERHSILDAECRRRIVSLSRWPSDAFLAPLQDASISADFEATLPTILPEGRAALCDSAELCALHERLTRASCTEVQFWFCFFQHVATLRRTVLPPDDARSSSEAARAADDEFEEFLASPLPCVSR